jgi:parvulin-like peptidyl-prolyl isomerase
MDGSDPASRATNSRDKSPSPSSWVWMIGSVAAVVAIIVATRFSSSPKAAAQAPIVKSGSPTAPPRPANPTQLPPTGQQPQRSPVSGPVAQTPVPQTGANPVAARPQGPPGAVQPAAATAPSKTPSLPPVATLQVMAVVNGEQITRTELGRETIRRYGEEVLESMVNRQLIADACAQKGVQVTDADISVEIDKVAGRFGLARDRWLQLLREERGFSEEQYRREVLWPMLALRQLVSNEIEVNDADMKKAIDSEFGAKVRCRLIAVDTPQAADQARAAAVADPNAFGEISKKFTVEPGVAAAYGVIPPIRRHLGDPLLEQVAFSLKPGQISEVVHVANMFYILKCEEIMPQQYLSNQQLAEQQARMKERIKENKLRASAADFFEKKKKEAQIELILGDKPEQLQKQQQMPGVAAIVNGRQLTLAQLADECITRHGSEVLDGEVNRKILQQELNRKQMAIDKTDIDSEVSRAADAYGFVTKEGKPDMERWLQSVTQQPGATVDLYIRDAVWPSVALKKLVGTRVEVTDEDLRRGYESNYGERVEVQAIVCGDQRQAQRVWDMARSNNTEPIFTELAEKYSIEPSSRSNGGKVPPIRRFGGSPLIEEEAFKLRPGELSGIVAVDGQYIILRCLGRTKPVPTNFNDVRPELVKDIQEKKLRILMTKEFDRLRDTSQVDNFIAGTSQSGARGASPVTLGPAPQQQRAGMISPAGQGMLPPPRAGALPPNGMPRPITGAPNGAMPASANMPRTVGPQTR